MYFIFHVPSLYGRMALACCVLNIDLVTWPLTPPPRTHTQTYISSPDKQFAAATIEAIGRVACSISEVTETCLHGLMSLLSHKSGNLILSPFPSLPCHSYFFINSSAYRGLLIFLISVLSILRECGCTECCGHKEASTTPRKRFLQCFLCFT